MDSWKCDKCGICCRVSFTKFWLPELWDEEKQRCKNLTDDNLCAIYESRPKICDVRYIRKIEKFDEFQKVWCSFLKEYIKYKEGENVK